jgi:hypothetical protein
MMSYQADDSIEAGDEVRVFDVNGRRARQPDGGWKGTVTKIGRTLIHIDYGNGGPRDDRPARKDISS